MLDLFAVFHRGGTVLWRQSFAALKGNPLDVLVRSVLLEDRTALPEYVAGAQRLQWSLENDLGLVFACASPRTIDAPYASVLLELAKVAFVDRYGPAVRESAGDWDTVDCDDFAEVFRRVRAKAESINKGQRHRSQRTPEPAASALAASDSEPVAADRSGPAGGAGAVPNSESDGAAPRDDAERAAEILRNRQRFAATRGRAKAPAKKSPPTVSEAGGGRPAKVMRESMKTGAITAEDVRKYDHSMQGGPIVDGSAAREVTAAEVEFTRQKYLNKDEASTYDLLDEIEEDDEDLEELSERALGRKKGDDAERRSKPKYRVFGFLQGLAGRKELSEADLEPAIAGFREMLIAKNVAAEIAEKLCDSVSRSLVGKRMESLTTVKRTVHGAMSSALTRILTPRQSVDILADISGAKRRASRPYVIVFCGVNGVGKSTSLSKICYYLQTNGLKVLMAACDTFRAGAVEQLRTHARCLKVEVFERGYGKDAASVAMEAIRRGQEDGVDVVLVDTAGRMQDNEPLMRSLAKLVEVNSPDRVLFVGEALVGNDAVDQLVKFDRALVDYQGVPGARTVDGIVLTKFDTIDDKVGAAVSMVYSTGQPIVFVGVGQTYMDLRRVNTEALVRALLR